MIKSSNACDLSSLTAPFVAFEVDMITMDLPENKYREPSRNP